MKRWLNTLQRKAVVYLAIGISAVFLIGSYIIYHYVSNAQIESVLGSCIYSIQLLDTRISGVLEEKERMGYSIAIDKDIQKLIYSRDKEDLSIREILSLSDKLRTQLLNYSLLRNEINLLGIKTYDGIVASDSMYGTSMVSELSEMPFITRFLDDGDNFCVGPVINIDDVKRQGQKLDIIPFTAKFWGADESYEKSKPSLLFVLLRFSYLKDIFEDFSKEFDGIEVFNINGEKLYSNIEIDNGKPVHEWTEENILVTETPAYYAVETAGEKMVYTGYIYKESISHQTRYFSFMMITIFVTTLAIVLLITTLLITRITRPLSELSTNLKDVGAGNIGQHMAITSGDEIQQLAETFNRMNDELSEYIDRLIVTEQQKQQVQLDLLLAQINPHFLYNTLNSVVYMAKFKQNDDIISLVHSLIYILQESVDLAAGNTYTTVQEEIELLKQYVVIQMYRYKGKFDIVWRVDEAVSEQIIPRFILQPILENAIIHGIYELERKGEITVAALQRDRETLELSVMDNGGSIPFETIEQCIAHQEKEGLKGYYHKVGLKNVKERLALLYGEKACLKLESEKELYTKFIIEIPFSKSIREVGK